LIVEKNMIACCEPLTCDFFLNLKTPWNNHAKKIEPSANLVPCFCSCPIFNERNMFWQHHIFQLCDVLNPWYVSNIISYYTYLSTYQCTYIKFHVATCIVSFLLCIAMGGESSSWWRKRAGCKIHIMGLSQCKKNSHNLKMTTIIFKTNNLHILKKLS
jgi:hypothetical protein